MGWKGVFLFGLCFGLGGCLDMKVIAPYEPGHDGSEPCLRICAGTTGRGL